MNHTSKRLRRRDFLTGAALALGSSVVAAIPGAAPAQGLGQGAGSGTGTVTLLPPPSLYYWTDSQFIPASQAVPNVGGDQIGVMIQAFGVSPNMATITIQMPGGPFKAFVAPPLGGSTAVFTAPVNTPLGLTLVVGNPMSSSILTLNPAGGGGLVLALGTYIMVDPGVSATGFVLGSSTTTPVTYADGQPIPVPYTLITITDP